MGTHSVAAGVSEWSQAGGKSNGRTNEEVSQPHTRSHRDPRRRTKSLVLYKHRGLQAAPPSHTHSWLETSTFSLFCSSFPLADSTFFSPPHSFAIASLLSFFPLYLSLTRLIAADLVFFCVAREIFQHVLWRTMPCLSRE